MRRPAEAVAALAARIQRRKTRGLQARRSRLDSSSCHQLASRSVAPGSLVMVRRRGRRPGGAQQPPRSFRCGARQPEEALSMASRCWSSGRARPARSSQVVASTWNLSRTMHVLHRRAPQAHGGLSRSVLHQRSVAEGARKQIAAALRHADRAGAGTAAGRADLEMKPLNASGPRRRSVPTRAVERRSPPAVVEAVPAAVAPPSLP